MSLVTAGRNHLTSLAIGSGTPFSLANAYIGVGNSTAATTAGMTDLQGASKFRKAVDSISVSGSTITAVVTLAAAEANFSIQEIALFNAASGGVMLDRKVEDHGTKASGDTMVITLSIPLTA